jgi:hypothetical protein
MASVTLCQHGPHHVGRERCKWATLPRAYSPPGALFPHDDDALRYAYAGSNVFFLLPQQSNIILTLIRFMDSLLWVDKTYVQKHKTEDPHNLRALYHQNLEQYPTQAPKTDKEKTPLKQAVIIYATKQGRKAAISLAVLGLSYVPYVGRFVLPAASFYTFRKSVGTQPAGAIFAASLLFPRRYLVSFLQAYFSSRTLMRELVCSAQVFCSSYMLTITSWNPTSHASATTKIKRNYGSKIVLVFSLDLA